MSEFKNFKIAVQKQLAFMVKEYGTLFVTDLNRDVLWEVYLGSFPEGTNPLYKTKTEFDCNCCRHFIRDIGTVVAVKDDELVSIWDAPDLQHPFNVVADKMAEAVKESHISNLFVAREKSVGTDKTHNLDPSSTVIQWHHFYCEIPNQYVAPHGVSVEATQGQYRDSKSVFQRSMEELTLDAGKTVLELIDQKSLYRGEEFKKAVTEFVSYKKKYTDKFNKASAKVKETWCWNATKNNPVARIRNTAIGTLLIDLSEGMDLDEAVRKFEKVMAPSNYKRPNTLFTKGMVEAAQAKIEELGFSDSLGRRFAVLDDITVNNVLYVNRDVKKKLGVFDELKESVPVNAKSFNKVEEVSVEDFISKILPTAKSLEIMFEVKHQGNLMSLIAPENKEAPSMLKWSNNFSWAYSGDITDSIKQNVKAAGGNVEGVLRFSIQWNDSESDQNDLDAHCKEPDGNRIWFREKVNPKTTGNLDIDITNPGSKVAVENITWTDINKMQEGKYLFFVNNYAHRGGKSGFSAEIEYGGEIYQYHYAHELKQGQNVVVAEIEFSKKEGIKFLKSLDSSVQSKGIWGIKTNQFTPVSMCMFSPNYWDGQVGIGNKHYFFVLQGCKNETQPRGFFNEFLKEELTPHRKVFEALGSKMRVEMSDDQLSGVGFSSTQRNSILAKVDGAFNRVIKINF